MRLNIATIARIYNNQTLEKLYALQHAEAVGRFELSMSEDKSRCRWISKGWLKGKIFSAQECNTTTDVPCQDWKLKRPKMHVPGNRDPLPDAPGFSSDIYCEHGGE